MSVTMRVRTMAMKKVRWAAPIAALGAAIACGSSTPPPREATASPGGSKDPAKWPADDRSMCNYKGKPELEVSETLGPGALKPNVRRVYKMFGDGDQRHKSLVCREIDTNLDGLKDVVRTFNAKGEAIHEEADTDYDGKIDIWSTFVEGRMTEEDVDTNHDGKIDVWKYYTDGHLSRIKRDRNFDGRPDVWEIYSNGRLERVGVDESYDGHVDRWDRDEQLKQEQEAADRKAMDAVGSDGGAGATATSSDAGSASDGGKGGVKATAAPPKPAKKK